MQVSTVSSIPATIAFRGTFEKTATAIQTQNTTLQKSPLPMRYESFSLPSVKDYQNQLRAQGQEEQSIVVTRGGTTVASIGQNGSAMFQDLFVANIWDKVEGDPEAFASALKKAGYNSEIYAQGTGPTYSEIHKQIHGESYEALIARQTIEFTQEQRLLSGKESYFSTVA